MKDRTDRDAPERSRESVGAEGVRGSATASGLAVEECEVCGSEMYGLHCKLVCPNCGYRRDCSDP